MASLLWKGWRRTKNLALIIVQFLGTLEAVFLCPLLPFSFDHLSG